MSRLLIIEADGGSRGNPGPSGSGAIVIDGHSGQILVEIAAFGGVATNNVAEYRALVAALQECSKIDSSAELLVRMDSKLVIEQMAGNWKIKHPDMQLLAIEAQKLVVGKPVTWQWIPRDENSRADALANIAMDSEQSIVKYLDSVEPVSGATVEFSATLPGSIRAPGNVSESLTTIILVRHGRTPLTESHKISGGTGDDPDLSELGEKDAKAAAALIATFGSSGPFAHLPKPEVIVSSPMNRTKQTAHAISLATGVPVEQLEELREISFGDWDGHTNQEVADKWPAEFEAWRGSWELSPPNGESLADFDARTSKARQTILTRHAGKCVVVVAHVMPIRGFLTLAMDAGSAGYWRPQVAPCSLTIIRHWGEDFAELVTANFTAHL
jgi:probable phosphoglycerate mutase